MKPCQALAALAIALCSALPSQSAEIFSYSAPDGRSGMRLASRADGASEWEPVAGGYVFFGSDFGPWGSHKVMFAPRLMRDLASGEWVCVFGADASGEVVGLASSADFKHWRPQRYYASVSDLPRDICFSGSLRPDTATIAGVRHAGARLCIEDAELDSIKAYAQRRRKIAQAYGETTAEDSVRYAALAEPQIRVTVDADAAKPISDKLIGIFFEDINYGADGGLYAELVQNRDFEYSASDHSGWNSLTAWKVAGQGSVRIDTVAPLHPNNPHYASLESYDGSLSIANQGFDGIVLRKGQRYNFAIHARAARPATLRMELRASDGSLLGSRNIKVKNDEWQKYRASITAKADADRATIVLKPGKGCKVDVDMVSLFPEATFKGRDNGLRADLAQALADLKPRFVRFPGGCVAHGNGIDNIYDWKGSVGPLESRKPLSNLWGYHQTRGLGYHEYFLFCEDIGAEPLPVVAAGVPCQNSGRAAHHSHDLLTSLGQQNGIPFDEMKAYVRDVLDLIEYANGATDTPWGAIRAAAGHPEPFNLRYIGIGNEDMITEVFEPRFRMIYDAVKAAYPDITVIGTVGPFYEGADYDRGWELARELALPMVDEHYYVSPGWLYNNRTYYETYDRSASKVYLGEWAAHLPGRPNNIETALAEALYLTDIERNADIVAMTSYAPLLAKDGHTQWRPDMIYFDNTSVSKTTDYYVQQIYGHNTGDRYLPARIEANLPDSALRRIGVSAVTDSRTDDTIVKIVNILPVALKLDIDLPGIYSGTYKATRIAGAPADEHTSPQEVEITLPRAHVPAYSFTVVRIGGKK
ncbi:MAG: alpha-L-arabinofuranosidase [Muribaculaceae bacterium]|nr:alpha-L-arabinofuranosidase [Muribaculaceae bacterium]